MFTYEGDPGGPVIAVAGGKGGCGTTTTTACLGQALAARDGDPVLVDADLDVPDLYARVGASRSPGLSAVADGSPVEAGFQSPVELPGARFVGDDGASGRTLHRALDRLDRLTGPVLVDTPSGASPLVGTTLRSASRAIVVTRETHRSLAAAAKTVELARALDARVAGIVVWGGSESVGTERLLGCRTLATVEPVETPLSADPVRRAFAAVLDRLAVRNV